MLAVRERAVEYLNAVPEEKLPGVIDYLRFVCEPKNPAEVTTKEELYRRIDEGMEDMRQGRVYPLEDVMREAHTLIDQYIGRTCYNIDIAQCHC